MKSLQDYIAETETWIDDPVPGDEFDIELAPDSLFETYIVDTMEDGVVLHADDTAMAVLEQHGVFTEDIKSYGAVGYGGMGQTFFEKDQVEEGRVKDLAIEIEDYKRMTPQQFLAAYGIKKADWAMKNHDLLQQQHLQTDWSGTSGFDYVRETSDYMARMLELAGCKNMEEDQSAAVLAQKEVDDAITEPMPGVLEDEHDMEEAKYQGREVKLGKPFLTPGGPKKRAVYVKNPKGNVVKVSFGDPNMRIKKSNPARRKSFRARHRCENPGPRTSARYWSCRFW